MVKSFSHADVFPLISRLITDKTDKLSDFVTHTELVNSLLATTEGAQLIDIAQQANKLGVRGTATNMVAWFSKRYTTGENEFKSLMERKKIGRNWAYRSLQSAKTNASIPDDVDQIAIEGNPKIKIHIVRERNSDLVKKKLAAVAEATGRLACECCGFDAAKIFPDIKSPIVEVHHRTMLSKFEGATKTTLADLALLCPTCHRAIHRNAELSVDEFRLMYFATK